MFPISSLKEKGAQYWRNSKFNLYFLYYFEARRNSTSLSLKSFTSIGYWIFNLSFIDFCILCLKPCLSGALGSHELGHVRIECPVSDNSVRDDVVLHVRLHHAGGPGSGQEAEQYQEVSPHVDILNKLKVKHQLSLDLLVFEMAKGD